MQALRECVARAYKHFSPTTSRRVLVHVVDPHDVAVRDRLRNLKLRNWQCSDALEYLNYATLGEDARGIQRVLPRLLDLLATERLASVWDHGTLLTVLVDALQHHGVHRWKREDHLIVESFFERYLLTVMRQQPSHAVQLALHLAPVVGNIDWCLRELLSDSFDPRALLQFLAACSQTDLGQSQRPTNAPPQVLRRWLGAESTSSCFEAVCRRRPSLKAEPSFPDACMCFTRFGRDS